MIKMAQYIITDGSRFIYRNYSGKYVPTSSEVMADIFTRKQAESIYKNSLPKALRMVFHVEKYDNNPNIKQVSQSDLMNNTERVMEAVNIKVWIQKLQDMNGLIAEATMRKEILEKQLHELENEKIDIEHYIEFQNLNAAQGYKASKELKICRIKRRAIKNELAVINIILNRKLNEVMNGEIIKKIEELDRRTYTPRIRNDLFDL